MKKRTGDPWIPADRYGRLLPAFMANLLVRDVAQSVEFYRTVLGGSVHYADPERAVRALAAMVQYSSYRRDAVDG